MSIEQIGVVGAGQMGAGIAQVAAQHGFKVVVTDVGNDALSRGKTMMQDSLERLVRKGVFAQEIASEVQSRIAWSTDLKSQISCQLVIEAVPENEVLKMKIFSELDAILPTDSILVSNTSSISITRLASVTKRPQQVMGMHFMNPVPLMKLVELICGLQTSPQTLQTVRSVAEKMGKIVTQSRDMPGFIANRILMPMINEAFFALMEGLASKEDIDNTMKFGTNQPMGPLQLADLIGLDTCLAIMQVLHEGLGDSKYRPCPLLSQYVDAGWVGKKAQRGVYQYGI